jgi:hypothetical protein
MPGVLHVTNGDSAAERIRAAGILGDVLPWRDVLHEGPVPGRLGFAQLREVRAGFIAERGWASEADARADFAARDALLAACGDRAEVVLWFEHDLYDQLQLLQVLHRFATQGPDPTRLTLACENEYLGMLSIDRIRALHARRTGLNHAQVRLAVEAWTAFTAPEAAGIARVIGEDTSALPYLAAALRRHLEEFPSTRTGLSRSEQQALEAVAAGADTLGESFLASHHEREDAVFLADTVFAWYLERMSRVREPLVTFDDGSLIGPLHAGDDHAAYWKRRVRVTEAGQAVVAGEENAVALNGIDRWLGGVHLEAQAGRPLLPPP